MESAEKVIRHEGGKWVLYTHDGSRKLGTYDTEEQAKKRERQIQFFRHQKGEGAMNMMETIASAFSKFGTWLKAEGCETCGEKADDDDDYEPTDEEILAAIRVLREAGLLKTEEKAGRGNVQALVSTFGSWAGGKHTQCVTQLRGKKGIRDPARLCAWLHDRYSGTTRWRGKKTGLMIHKQRDGNYRWVGWVSNHFRDNDNPPEIISGKAHRAYVAWADKNKTYPDLWLWHMPGTRIGKADLVDFTDGFLVASGVIDAGGKGPAEKLAGMSGLTMSHGFVRLKPMGDDGVTDAYRIFEASIVPQGAEANPFTAFKAMEVTMNDKKRKFLVDTLGEEKVAAIESDTAALRKAAEEAGVDWKAVEGDDPTEVSTTAEESVVGPALTAQVNVGELAAAIAEHLQLGKLSEMLEGLQTKVEWHDAALAEVAGTVKALSRTDDVKVAEALTPKAALTFAWTGKPASKSADTVVKAGDAEDDKLIDRKPWLAAISEQAAASLATR